MIYLEKLLLIAIALVAAGSIAFAISAFTGSSGDRTPGAPQVHQDASGVRGTLSTNSCIDDLYILYCVPSEAGWCEVAFTAKHWDHSDDCCIHDAGTLWFRIGSGDYTAMTKDSTAYYDDDEDCWYHNYTIVCYLQNNFGVTCDAYDSADSTCVYGRAASRSIASSADFVSLGARAWPTHTPRAFYRFRMTKATKNG